MRIDVFTIFPDLVETFAAASLLGRARRDGRLDVRVHDLRSGTDDPHRSVDDAPFGGGAGMLMRPEPIFAAVEAADPPRPLYLLGPGGRRFDQAMAHELAAQNGIDMPICEEAYKVLYDCKSPRDAMRDLMARDKKREDASGEESWVG